MIIVLTFKVIKTICLIKNNQIKSLKKLNPTMHLLLENITLPREIIQEEIVVRINHHKVKIVGYLMYKMEVKKNGGNNYYYLFLN